MGEDMTVDELVDALTDMVRDTPILGSHPVIVHDDTGRDDGPQDLDVTRVRFADNVLYLDALVDTVDRDNIPVTGQ